MDNLSRLPAINTLSDEDDELVRAFLAASMFFRRDNVSSGLRSFSVTEERKGG